MPKNLPDGLVIIFEGSDGVGKTTQLRLAKDELAKSGWPIMARRNLGGTPIGEELRTIIKGSTPRPSLTNLYISAAIQAALVEQIREDRQASQLILMDRGPLSLAAYEIYGSQLDESLGWPHIDYGMAQLNPELTIIYKTDTLLALERAKQQTGKLDHFESQPQDYFERVAAGYDALASRYKNTLVIDARQSIEAVHADTMQAIRNVLPRAS